MHMYFHVHNTHTQCHIKTTKSHFAQKICNARPESVEEHLHQWGFRGVVWQELEEGMSSSVMRQETQIDKLCTVMYNIYMNVYIHVPCRLKMCTDIYRVDPH